MAGPSKWRGRLFSIAIGVVLAAGCQGGGGGDCETCPAEPCGDGEVGSGEDCDPGAAPPATWNLGARSCADLAGDGTAGEVGDFTGGTLGCTAGCTRDGSACTWACGDGVLNGGELCDGAQ